MRFGTFLVRRLCYSVLVLFGLSITIFVIARMLPGDPARLALGSFATEEQVQHLREDMGMDRPLPAQYVSYIMGLFRGDFGLSFQTRRAVSLDIGHYLPATLELVTVSMVWVLLFGVVFGVLAGRYKDTWIDNVVRVIAFVGVAVPPFVAGLLFQFIFSYSLDILPTTGRLSLLVTPPTAHTGFLILDCIVDGNWHALGDSLRHILLPSLAMAWGGIGQIARLTRASVSDVAGRDYIEASRAFGISERTVSQKYMLKPAFIAPLTILGLTFASELSNAFLIETVFSWPGLAKYGVRAILMKDFNAVMGTVLIVGLAFLLINIVVDILAGFVDPRIRVEQES